MAGEVLTTSSARVNEILREMKRRGLRKHNAARDAAWANLRRIGVGRAPIVVPDRNQDAGKTIDDVLPDGSWRGQRCFIIGGGPSLKGFDFSHLAGELVIGVNRAYEKLDCTVMYSMDDSFYDWARRGAFGAAALESYIAFCGYRVWAHFYGDLPAGYFSIKLKDGEGLPHSIADGFSHGNNSGYSALQLAYCLGANPIYLLGFDMKHEGDASHWHDGYPHRGTAAALESFKGPFERLAPALARAGVSVVNLNPDSALTAFPKARFEDLPAGRMPTVVSFYTRGNGYGAEAAHLVNSLRRWNLPRDVREIADRGGWQENTRYKPRFLLEAMDRHPGRPLVWVDCDAVMAEYPALFQEVDADIAVRFRGEELLSGVLYLAPTAKARELLELWDAENARCPDKWDQANLQAVLRDWDGKLMRLPAEYCHIFDDAAAEARPVIVQYQASRRLKGRPDEVTGASAPLVSIVMPAYNQAKFIRQAIDSILAQTYSNFELIVVNDGSTDETAAIVKSYADPRVRYLEKPNGGTGSALNFGFSAAGGEYETWFASDNVLYPQALARLVDHMADRPGADFVYANCELGTMDPAGTKELSRKNINEELGDQAYAPGRSMKHYYFGIAWLWRRKLREKAGPFQLEPCEDYDMVLRMEEAGGRFELIPDCLAWFRRHGANMTARTPLATVHAVQAKAEARRANAWRLIRIPKIAHFYWGNQPMPFLRLLTIQSFCRHNPDWEVRLYRPAAGDVVKGGWPTFEHAVEITGADCSAGLAGLPVEIITVQVRPGMPEVFRSDILRWEILAETGGLWSDMDILWTAPLARFVANVAENEAAEWSVCMSEYGHSIGFILAAPGNPFYGYISKRAGELAAGKGYQDFGSRLLNVDFKRAEDIKRRFPGKSFIDIPMDVVYAYATHEITAELYGPRASRRRTTANSIGVHWYAGHPESGRALNALTADTWRTEDMLICEHIREAIDG